MELNRDSGSDAVICFGQVDYMPSGNVVAAVGFEGTEESLGDNCSVGQDDSAGLGITSKGR